MDVIDFAHKKNVSLVPAQISPEAWARRLQTDLDERYLSEICKDAKANGALGRKWVRKAKPEEMAAALDDHEAEWSPAEKATVLKELTDATCRRRTQEARDCGATGEEITKLEKDQEARMARAAAASDSFKNTAGLEELFRSCNVTIPYSRLWGIVQQEMKKRDDTVRAVEGRTNRLQRPIAEENIDQDTAYAVVGRIAQSTDARMPWGPEKPWQDEMERMRGFLSICTGLSHDCIDGAYGALGILGDARDAAEQGQAPGTDADDFLSKMRSEETERWDVPVEMVKRMQTAISRRGPGDRHLDKELHDVRRAYSKTHGD